jgi:thiol:disulfide interchange protein DsbA
MNARSVSPPAWLGAALSAVLAIGALVPGTGLSEEIDEGIDYRVVPEPARAEEGDDVEVLELFWYGCPHCYQLEPHIERWADGRPEGVSFRRLPAATSPRWVPHAKAYFAAEMLGQLERLHEPLFRALHDQRRKIFNEDQIIAFAVEQGFDEQEFRSAYESFPVDMQVRQAAALAKGYGIDGVPTIIVNGKYLTSATLTGSRAKMFAVIDRLVAKELAAGGAESAAGTGGQG